MGVDGERLVRSSQLLRTRRTDGELCFVGPRLGGNASFRLVLPSSNGAYSQGDFYATFWFGGAVYDPQSLDGQAYLELQFYPAPPTYTGPGSGVEDCLSNGGFSPSWTNGTNDWFVCAPVWEINATGAEMNAANAAPLDEYGSNGAILVMHSGDSLFVNYSATGPTAPWALNVRDMTLGENGTIYLENTSRTPAGLGPYYATAASGNILSWGASGPGAIAFAYEIGHALNPAIPETNTTYAGCSPGDGYCDSYWPGRWAQSGQMELSLPRLGPDGAGGFPSRAYFSSSEGGEAIVNASKCGAPSFSSTTNCLYPYYIYRSSDYSFTFGTSNVTNTTHNYGSVYQFPSTVDSGGAYTPHFFQPPWAWLNVSVTPANATVFVNARGIVSALPVNASGIYNAEYAEGPYWVNATAPGCLPASDPTYLFAGHPAALSMELDCSSPSRYSATFKEAGLPFGTSWSVTLNGATLSSTTSTITFNEANGTYAYSIADVAGWHQATLPYAGSVVVNGASVSEPTLVFTGVTYAVTFTETGLLSGTSWSVTLNGTTSSATTNTVAFTEANGTYPFTVGSVAGYRSSPSSGSVTEDGAAVSESIAFTAIPPATYPVTFAETGLPSGTSWSVTLNGATSGSTTSRITFSETNGTYPYSIAPIAGYSTTYSGQVTVNGASVSEAVTFTQVTYTVTFTENGLPSGASWSVTLSGATHSSTTTTVSFTEANGTYAFTVGAVAGYTVNPSTGSLTVRGGSASQAVAFSSTGNESPSGFLGVSGNTGYYVVGGLGALVVVGVVVGLILRTRRK